MHIDVAWKLHLAEQWRESLLASLMSKFNALQTLHITFDQDFSCLSMEYLFRLQNPQVFDPLLAMQTLALKSVTAVISDRIAERSYQRASVAYQRRWTIERKREVAEDLRSSLLNRMVTATSLPEDAKIGPLKMEARGESGPIFDWKREKQSSPIPD